jgi:hypothetical protein
MPAANENPIVLVKGDFEIEAEESNNAQVSLSHHV